MPGACANSAGHTMNIIELLLTAMGAAVLWLAAFAGLLIIMTITWLSIARLVGSAADLLGQIKNEHKREQW